MYHIHTTPFYAFNYDEAVKYIKNREQVYITGVNGEREAVLISAEEYEKIKEALWERHIDQKLAEATEDAKRPDAKVYTMEEFFAPLYEEYGHDL